MAYLARGIGVVDFGVRIGYRGLPDVIVHGAAAPLVGADQLDLDPGSVFHFPFHDLVADHLGSVLPGVDLYLVIVGRLSRTRPGCHQNGLPRRQQAVHSGG